MSTRARSLLMAAVGAVFVGLGGWAAADAASFTRLVAGFGPYNPHLVHDFAACSTTFGAGLLVGARVPSWRAPALALAATWNGLHTLSHIADLHRARPAVLGPVEAGLLFTITVVLATWSVTEHRRGRDDANSKEKSS